MKAHANPKLIKFLIKSIKKEKERPYLSRFIPFIKERNGMNKLIEDALILPNIRRKHKKSYIDPNAISDYNDIVIQKPLRISNALFNHDIPKSSCKKIIHSSGTFDNIETMVTPYIRRQSVDNPNEYGKYLANKEKSIYKFWKQRLKSL